MNIHSNSIETTPAATAQPTDAAIAAGMQGPAVQVCNLVNMSFFVSDRIGSFSSNSCPAETDPTVFALYDGDTRLRELRAAFYAALEKRASQRRDISPTFARDLSEMSEKEMREVFVAHSSGMKAEKLDRVKVSGEADYAA
jgi:hypothetical protein